MANNYYNFSDTFTPGQKARSSDIDREYSAIETAFDLLPTDTEAFARGTTTYAGATTGSGNAYVAARPNPSSVDAAGDQVVFLADRTNTGAATLNVDTNGARSLVRGSGDAVIAGDITIGLIYVARYDLANTRWQLVSPAPGDILAAAASAAAALASENNAATSESNAATSETNAGVSETNAASSESLAQEWAENPEDVAVTGNPGEFSAFHWAQKAAASTSGGLIIDPSVVDPTGGGPYNYSADVEIQNTNLEVLGTMGWISTDLFGLESQVYGATFGLRGRQAGGGLVNLLAGDPDGAMGLYHNGGLKVGTTSLGWQIRNGGNGDPTVPTVQSMELQFVSNDLNEYANIGYSASANLQMQNLAYGGLTRLLGTSSAGAARTLLDADPDGSISVYHGGEQRLVTGGAGILSLLSSGNTDTEPRRFIYEHSDGTDRAWTGHNTSSAFEIRNLIHSGLVQIWGEDSIGTAVQLFEGNPDGAASLYYDAGLRMSTTSSGIEVHSSGNTDAENRLLQLHHQDGTRRAYFGNAGSAELRIVNEIHGGEVAIRGENTATGALRTLIQADPDADVEIWYPGGNVVRAQTQATGNFAILSDGNTDTEVRRLVFEHQNGTDRAFVGHNSTTELQVRNLINSGNLALRANDSGGTARLLLLGDANGQLSLYYNGTLTARTQTVANGGLEADNGGAGIGPVVVSEDTVGNRVITKYKDADTSRDSGGTGSTLTDDDDLAGFVLEADMMYAVEAHIEFRSTSATPGAKWAFQASSANQDSGYSFHLADQGAVSSGDHTTLTAIEAMALVANATRSLNIKGYVFTNTSSPPTIDFQWAQNTADATATVLQRGSWIKFTRLGTA